MFFKKIFLFQIYFIFFQSKQKNISFFFKCIKKMAKSGQNSYLARFGQISFCFILWKKIKTIPGRNPPGGKTWKI